MHNKYSIYRTEAVRQYVKKNERVALPKLVSPKTIYILWVIAGVLISAGAFGLLAKVPVYASAIAVVVGKDGSSEEGPPALAVLVCLSSEELTRLKSGQRVTFVIGKSNQSVSGPIFAIEPNVLSPKTVQERFRLSSGTGSHISEPKAVALARWRPEPTGPSVDSLIGSVYDARVEVGSRRVISLFPIVGNVFGQ